MRRTILCTFALAAATATSAMAQTRGVHSPVATTTNGRVINTIPNQCVQRTVLGTVIPSNCRIDQQSPQERHRIEQARKHAWKKAMNERKHERQRRERELRKADHDRRDFDRDHDRDRDGDHRFDGRRHH